MFTRLTYHNLKWLVKSIFILGIFGGSLLLHKDISIAETKTISYSQFLNDVEEGKVKEVGIDIGKTISY